MKKKIKPANSKSKLSKKKLSKKKLSKKKIPKPKIIKLKLRKNSQIPKNKILSENEITNILKKLKNISDKNDKIFYQNKFMTTIPYQYKFHKNFIDKHEINNHKKELDQLIDEDIILYFIDSTNSSNNKKIFGTLNRGPISGVYLLQFNPLTQHLYITDEEYHESQKNSPIDLHSYNEEHVRNELDLSFETPNTYEIEFSLWQVTNVTLPKTGLKNTYLKGEVTIISTIDKLIMREIN